MQFGHEEEGINKIDFSLPADAAMTAYTLEADKSTEDFKVYVGCPKWTSKEWIGNIYPLRIKEKDFLTEYTRHFNSIEFNPTFYDIPSPERIMDWKQKADLAPGFKFCPKFPQQITHIRRFRNAEDATARFYQGIRAFGESLGPAFLQAGDNLSPKSLPELTSYLETLPKDVQLFLEVRHKDWFAIPDYRHGLFKLLRDNNIGAVITDAAGRRDCVHMTLPTPHAMIRFVGNNLHETDYKRFDDWVERIKAWRDQGLQSLWFFMHQHDERTVPQACAELIERLNMKLGLTLKAPKLRAQ